MGIKTKKCPTCGHDGPTVTICDQCGKEITMSGDQFYNQRFSVKYRDAKKGLWFESVISAHDFCSRSCLEWFFVHFGNGISEIEWKLEGAGILDDGK